MKKRAGGAIEDLQDDNSEVFRVKVEVLGKGCLKCKKTEELIETTLKKIGVEAEIVHITDLEEIVDRGVLMTPAVIVDGEKKIEGRIPSEAEIRQWFGK